MKDKSILVLLVVVCMVAAGSTIYNLELHKKIPDFSNLHDNNQQPQFLELKEKPQ